jgi:dTDP-glucose pyrophosphorylase/thiamine kinase-like enzyme
MSQAVVCILTSGRGTRMGEFCEIANKAILPIDNKGVISHIINQFPLDSKFIISLGFKADQVRNYLDIAHSDADIEYVTVDKFEGEGTGPGYSLSCCKEHLNRPFYFVSCDTLWTNDIPLDIEENWFGTAPVAAEDSKHYCNFKIKDGKIAGIFDKERVSGNEYEAFVGLCFIHDHIKFWKSLEAKDLIRGELQISNGIRALVANGEAKAVPIHWIDVGNEDLYQEVRALYEDFNFSKSNEFFYTINNKVIKFFADAKITELRVKKAALNPAVFPQISFHKDQFYAYEFLPGDVLYDLNSPERFTKFLQWLKKELWKPVEVDKKVFTKACRHFYFEKTKQRLEKYFAKYPGDDKPFILDGEKLPSCSELIAQVPWDELENGIPVFMHGDLQFDNVIYNEKTGEFALIDWRQDFAGHVEFGDWYYDLAKMVGGILLNYDYVKKNLMSYHEDGDKVTIDFATRYLSNKYENILTDFIKDQGLDIARVHMLRALIYLNMSPLHHNPFDKLLRALGVKLLSDALKEYKNASGK